MNKHSRNTKEELETEKNIERGRLHGHLQQTEKHKVVLCVMYSRGQDVEVVDRESPVRTTRVCSETEAYSIRKG